MTCLKYLIKTQELALWNKETKSFSMSSLIPR